MLITITRTLENNVHKAVVETEANALDQAYMKAYGEPKVAMGGTLSYPDPSRVPQSVTTDDAVAGVTSINGSVIVSFRVGAVDLTQFKVGDTATFSDVNLFPAINGAHVVTAVDEIHSAIAYAGSVGTTNPLTTPVTIGTVTIGAQIEGQSLAGFVDNGSTLVLQLRSDTVLNLALVTPNVDSIVMSGVTLETGLNGTFLITAVSVGSKTITIASEALVSQPIFAVPTPNGNLAHTLGDVSFIVPVSDVYIRSSSPFAMSLSANTDSAAGAKVLAWAEDLRDKIVVAVQTLKAQPNPNASYPIVETTEVA